MKKSKVFIMVFLLAILLVGMSACSNSSNDNQLTTDKKAQNSVGSPSSFVPSTDKKIESDDSSEDNEDEQSSISSDGNNTDISDNQVTNNNDSNEEKMEEKEILSNYSSQEIEYARVWLQLGPNQDLDELIVTHIPAGAPLDPDDEESLGYPEDVIRLTGSRIVDGIVTYSGNGDGTINVYNVPLRWYGGFPPPDDIDKDAIREQMEEMITNTKLVYVDPGDDDKVIALIKLLNVH